MNQILNAEGQYITIDQLRAFDTGLGLALAEAVLGWGAHAYLEARARHSRPQDLARLCVPV